MAFFDNFKLLKRKSGIVVKYKNDTFITIKPQTLKAVVLDHLSKKVVEEIATQITPAIQTRKTNTAAIKLMNCYNKMKKEYYKNPKMRDITTKNKEFRHFIQAAELLKTHKAQPKEFIQAQIDGLQFVNNSQGVFPKPQQLSTIEAEERYVKSQHTALSLETNRLELKQADRETELMQNPRFVSRYNKMKENTASLQDAYFVYDCMLARKGRVTSFVDDYIEELENE